MSKQALIILRDDLDGSAGDDVTTYPFTTHRGDAYEIELSDASAAAFDAAIAPFIEAARKVKKRAKRSHKKQTQPAQPAASTNGAAPHASSTNGDAGARRIRAWAKNNGYKVAVRGVIPREVIEAHEQAHPEQPACIHPRTYSSGPRQGQCTKCHQQVEV